MVSTQIIIFIIIFFYLVAMKNISDPDTIESFANLDYYALSQNERDLYDLKTIDYEKFNKYLQGKKVDTIFPDKLKDKIDNSDYSHIDKTLLLLYNLYESIIKIDGFDLSTYMNMIHPYREDGLKKTYGIFTVLEINHAIKTIYNLQKNGKLNLNLSQKKSITSYYKKNLAIDEIKKIIDQKEPNFINCTRIIEKYFKEQYPKSNIVKLFSFNKFSSNSLDLHSFSLEEINILKNLFVSLPEHPCSIIDMILKINKVRETKLNQDFKDCVPKLKQYVEKMYNLYNLPMEENKSILEDNLLKHDLDYLGYIEKIYKYVNNCEKLDKYIKTGVTEEEKKSFKMFGEDHYKSHLIDSINQKKKNIGELKDCLQKLKEYMKTQYYRAGIPTPKCNDLSKYPVENLNIYHTRELEAIHEIYKSLPTCNNMDKEGFIDNIQDVYEYIIKINSTTYGCLASIDTYLKKTFNKSKIDLKYLDFNDRSLLRKLDIKNLEVILDIVKKIPPCLELTKDGKAEFDRRIASYLSEYDQNYQGEGIFKFNTYRPQIKYDINKFSKEKTHYPYYPVYSEEPDTPLSFEKIIDEGSKLNDFFKESDLFPKCPKYDKSKRPIQNLEKCISTYLTQHDSEGTTSIFSPSVEIDTNVISKDGVVSDKDIKIDYKPPTNKN